MQNLFANILARRNSLCSMWSFVVTFVFILPTASAQEATFTNSDETSISEKTIRFASNDFGAGILHATKDGALYLWFPGRTDVIKGSWNLHDVGLTRKTSSSGGVVKTDFQLICFEYSKPLRATVRGEAFKSRECLRSDELKSITREMADGDVLKLTSGRTPCKLCRSESTLARLRQNLRE